MAFFLFLRQNSISSCESSPFAADFQTCRIDVYIKAEVAAYNKYLEILKHSRRQQFQVVRTATQRNYQAGLTRAAHLPIKTKTWDSQNFFRRRVLRAGARHCLRSLDGTTRRTCTRTCCS